MPFGITLGQTLHGEARLQELFIDLIAHLEALQGNTRAYNGRDILCPTLQLLECLLNNTTYRTAPTGMDGSYTMLTLVEEKNGDAVGRLDSYAKTRLIGNDSIGIGYLAKGIHPAYIGAVSLTGNHDVCGIYQYAFTFQAGLTGICSGFSSIILLFMGLSSSAYRVSFDFRRGLSPGRWLIRSPAGGWQRVPEFFSDRSFDKLVATDVLH